VDAPYLDCAYKLEEYAGRPRRKRSWGKETWPGRKQVYRRFDADGRIVGDTVALETESVEGVPLLQCVMRGGRRLAPAETLVTIAARTRASLGSLPSMCLDLVRPVPLVPAISRGIRALADAVDRVTG